MEASRVGRWAVGVLAAALVGQSSIAWGGTVAYWRFEEGPADGPVVKGGVPDGVFHPGVVDSSGNGNDLSAWSEGGHAGYVYRTSVPGAPVPQTGAVNNYSVQNSGGAPGMFTRTGAPIQSIQPAAFTIELSVMPESGNYRTYVGRDSQGTATQDQALAALYLQRTTEDRLAIKFCDVSGYWHEAVSPAGSFPGFDWPNVDQGRWYNIAAVSDGTLLSLYVDDVAAGTGYQLFAQTDMALSGSPNTALTAGAGDGGDWDAGNWSVGRGLFNGGHTDRGYGFIDEVRISDSALSLNEFLFVPEPSSILCLALLSMVSLGRRRDIGK
jgi:hypothetical protein